ncbi:MAG: phosphatase PAP2 family protein [Thermoleophilaceae bacterium]
MTRSVSRTAALAAAAWVVLLLLGFATGRLITDANPHWDGALLADVRGTGAGALTDAMRFVTSLGATLVLDVVFVLAICGAALRRRMRVVVFILLASPGTVLLVQILKQWVGRPRPAALHLSGASGLSWPSGHASSSLALYGAIALVLALPARRRAITLLGVCVAVVLVAAIGFSRLYLGVHYPSDVAAAWLLTGAWLFVLDRLIAPRVGRGAGNRPYDDLDDCQPATESAPLSA